MWMKEDYDSKNAKEHYDSVSVEIPKRSLQLCEDG